MLRAAVAACAIALLALAAPALAKGPAIVSEVAAGDTELNAGLTSFSIAFAFLDANGNGKVDTANPDEPVYLDADRSGSVTYGDLRLTAFPGYTAGSLVDFTHRDAGRALQLATQAYFAKAAGELVLHLDNGASVAAGDLRFPAGAPEKIQTGDPIIGSSLDRASTPLSLGFTGPSPRAPTSALYLDMDTFSNGGGRVSIGDLRIANTGFAAEPAAQGSGAVGALTAPGESGLRALDGILIVLAALNLAGLLFVVRSLNQLRGPPKNPFK